MSASTIFLDPKRDLELLYPKQNEVLFSKDGSVGIAYCMPQDLEVVLSSAILRLEIKNHNIISPKGYQYVDLSSVDRELSQITQTTPINAKNAPSRARYIIQTDDVLLGTTRPLLKRYALVRSQHSGQICSTGFCVLRAELTRVIPQWVYYNIASERFLSHARTWQEGTSYPMLADKHVMSFLIPLPSLPIQKKIASILDQLQALISDLKQGISAEIKVRKKQFNYYLNHLLDFKGQA
ncbi:restriction endonuclease subunit S [Helicobacter suis]|uniref:restriction endonuclease subunit S n=1 Tax=Helicobacter suis TaxID=104628 RepID=UPI001F083157|nr:restriction endonuclease subunit S [Helicobacter suis]